MSKKINCPYLVIDNFYNDPDKIREFVLKQEFKIPTYALSLIHI